MPTFPNVVVSGQVISAAHMNSIRTAMIASYAEVYVWSGPVNAAGFNLSGVGQISATGITGTSMTIADTTPQFVLTESDGSANAKIWRSYASGQILRFDCVNDSFTAATNWLTVSRNGITPTSIIFEASVAISATLPQLGWTETSAITDQKKWRTYATGGALHHTTVNDSESLAVAWMSVTRAGNKANEVTIDANNGLLVRSISSSERQVYFSNDVSNYYYLGRRSSDGLCIFAGNQAAPLCGYTFSTTGVERVRITHMGLHILPSTLLTFANNAAAITYGCPAGTIYQVTGTNPRQLAVVF